MKNECSKLRLLLWKNWKLQGRHVWRTMLEMFAPVVLVMVVVGSRSSVPREVARDVTGFPAFSPLRNVGTEGKDLTIAWSPKDNSSGSFYSEARSMMHDAFNKTRYNLREFSTEEELQRFLRKHHVTLLGGGGGGPRAHRGQPVLCGAVLNDAATSGAGAAAPRLCSRDMQLTLRFPGKLRTMPGHSFQTDKIFPEKERAGPRSTGPRGPPPNYYEEGFVEIQHLISHALSNYCLKHNPPQAFSGTSHENLQDLLLPRVELRQFSYPPYIKDKFLENMSIWIPLVIMLSFCFSFAFTVNDMTMEKEAQLKDAMKIMGLSDTLHLTGWFIKTVILMMGSAILIVMLLKTDWIADTAVFPLTNSFIFFLLMLMFVIATSCFCFLVSVFFSSAVKGLIMSAFIWILTWVPFLMFKLMSTENLSLKILMCLFSNTTMAFGIVLIINSETIGVGMQWHNIMQRITIQDPLKMGYVLLMLLADSVLYLLASLYVDAVFPGSSDVPKRWNYCFKVSYWKGHKGHLVPELVETPPQDPTKFEEEPMDLRVAIQIKNLNKEFRKDRVAVKNLTLNIYEGQITVILGHNGAGKTTTMNMLTGMYPPTSGCALMDGCAGAESLQREAAGAVSLGVCPQQNLLFDELTVIEHLYFFGKLKGLTGDPLLQQIQRFLVLLDLQSVGSVISKNLSAGVKRKLSVCIALCGSPNVVLLDEPTTGMDAWARHLFWDMLKAEKQNRAVVVATHLMAEAEVLADRIAILDDGILQCCGSPCFLKRRYGAGYRLSVEVGPHCSTTELTDLMEEHGVRSAAPRRQHNELFFQLEEEATPRLQPLLAALDDQKDILDVRSFCISLTSMEEVFMRAVKEAGHFGLRESETHRPQSPDYILRLRCLELAPNVGVSDTENAKDLERRRVLRQQAQAVFLKVRVMFARGWLMFLASSLLPLLLFAIVMIPLSLFRKPRILPPLAISLKTYEKPITTVAVTSTEYGDVNIPNNKTQFGIAMRLYESYKEIVQRNKLENARLRDLGYQSNPSTAFENEIIRMYKRDVTLTRQAFIAGASFEERNLTEQWQLVTGWFNDFPLHAVPLALSLVHNAVLNIVDVSLLVVNHPLPFTPESLSGYANISEEAIQYALLFGFVMALTTPYYIVLPVRERSSKAKHLQHISGMNIYVYWIVHFIWDGLSLLVPIAGIVVILISYQEDGYASTEDIGRMIVILTSFGWAVLPIMYFASHCFRVPTTAYVTVLVINIMTAFIGVALVVTLQRGTAVTSSWLLLFIPHYCFVQAVYNAHINFVRKKSCERVDCSVEDVDSCCPGKCPQHGCLTYYHNFFHVDVPGIGKNILYFIWTGVTVMALLFIIEKRLIWLSWTPKSSIPSNEDVSVSPLFGCDSDVLEEKITIETADENCLKEEYSVVFRSVSKYYKKKLALDHICIGIKKNECFGLLGGDGDGKSTVLKILVGDERLSYGSVFVNGFDLKDDAAKVRRQIGYCPQVDALLGAMTGRETLYMYSLLKGIPYNLIADLIDLISEELLFKSLLNVEVKEYSGGNKRKLSIGIALIGGPSILVLDEPTRGLDPEARSRAWNLINKLRDSGSSVILATNSMEECEALSSRMAIMVGGVLKCLGTSLHLKSKFSQGYVLHVKVSGRRRWESAQGTLDLTLPLTGNNSDLDCNILAVERFISTAFPSSILNRKYMGFLTYLIPETDLTCSEMFGILERAKNKYGIEDYSLGQTSLEQVFLFFCVQRRFEN